MRFTALEAFSGLGGWRYALGDMGRVAAAYDISPHANAAYAFNHLDAPRTRELASVPAREIVALQADLWMMSPPCQPYCRMGKGEGLEDPRSRAFLRLLDLMDVAPPRHLLLENVPGFAQTEGHSLLLAKLGALGFEVVEHQLCPTAFGIPNQRPRYFLAASVDGVSRQAPPDLEPGPLAPFLDAVEDASLYLDEGVLAKHKQGLDLVRAEGHRTACFIGGYGRRYVGGGSYLVTDRGIRRFSPAEVARLLGYPASFGFPDGIPLEARYKLLGNGLSLPVAAWVTGLLGHPA